MTRPCARFRFINAVVGSPRLAGHMHILAAGPILLLMAAYFWLRLDLSAKVSLARRTRFADHRRRCCRHYRLHADDDKRDARRRLLHAGYAALLRVTLGHATTAIGHAGPMRAAAFP